MTYLDFATPAIAAGAIQRRDSNWKLPNGEIVQSARDVLRKLDLEPVPAPQPKARTFRQIKAEAARLAAKYGRTATLNVRAMQYHEALHGRETPHSTNLGGQSYCVRMDTTSDGTKRARFVGNWEIPHWDFTPSIEVLEMADA